MARKAKPRRVFDIKRAERAEKALDTYQFALGEDGPHTSERIRDLLQDMLHWFSWQNVEQSASSWWRVEDPRAAMGEALQAAIDDFPVELLEDGLITEEEMIAMWWRSA